MDKNIGFSDLGTPIYDDLTIEVQPYTDNNGNKNPFIRINLQNVLISVSSSNKIVRTDIAGRDGSVFEFIGRDDNRISISGIITGKNGVRPIDDITELKKVLNSVIPIQVSCKFLNQLGITDLIIESSEIPQQEGGYSYQQFQVQCYEFIPHELRLSNV